MRPFAEQDFPIVAIGNLVYRSLDSSPICTAIDDDMALEIARRLNRDNCVYPDPEGERMAFAQMVARDVALLPLRVVARDQTQLSADLMKRLISGE